MCPVRDAPLIVQYLRAIEINHGLKSDLPKDFHKGAYVCKVCHRYSIPICFKKNSKKCLNEACRDKKLLAEQEKQSNKRKMEEVLDYMQTRDFKKSCSKCACSIKCRMDELKPRANEHTGVLMVKLCYRHRFLDPRQQCLVELPTTGQFVNESHSIIACMDLTVSLANATLANATLANSIIALTLSSIACSRG